MVKTVKAISFTLLWLMATSVAIGSQDAQHRKESPVDVRGLVMRFYPSELVDQSYPNIRPYCRAVYATFKTGVPSVIFANYPYRLGEFLVIRRRVGGGYWAEPVAPSAEVVGASGDQFGQVGCTISFVKISSEVGRVVVLALLGNGGSARDWVFEWNGDSAMNIGPVDHHSEAGYDPDFVNVGFMHLYRHSMAAISQADLNEGDGRPFYSHVYQLEGNHYVSAGYSAFTALYRSESSQENGSTQTFVLTEGSAGPYVLRIGNGDWAGKHRVSDAQIWINGVKVISSGIVNGETNVLTLPLKGIIKYKNTIKVSIQGTPSSELAVSIEDHTPGLQLPDIYPVASGSQ